MGTTPIRTFTIQKLQPLLDKSNAKEIPIRLVAAKAYPRGSRLKESATRGVYDLWDGTGSWQLLCSNDCQTDADGKITLSATAGNVFGTEHGTFELSTTGYYNGAFDTKDLPAFNGAALTGAPAGSRLLSGTAADGLLYIP